ncbi:tRNA-uridine aminocarboxypropyltransferase [Haliangium ochraceum]|uniref:tRNA-uridine aminocarboxypropyltransferase n=1 Tax=Haliangium ochraceum (strain DSM 14365 / JCM 11303 / SMP-2) TaxID=502025 RepID=D0LUX4_HALO1|nr:tRNA-uridine aminocarboxypropyltransferase [Haliangium ochraceum]ACY14014.1 DTW domain containing protein [Haliangium ochraceum DSM 14365]
MSRRGPFTDRCEHCLMHIELCICACVPRVDTATRLVLVIHHTEIRKPTNTGRLAVEALVNSEVHVRGLVGEPSTAIDWQGRRPLLLFPHAEAEVLAPSDEPVALVVPDGTWGQAAKVRTRVPGLGDVRCVTLPLGPPSRYRLRSAPQSHGLATLEAIARAMGILEGAQVQDQLERLFRIMVERTLWSRGVLAADEVTGGIPADAKRRPSRGLNRRPPSPRQLADAREAAAGPEHDDVNGDGDGGSR